MRAPRLGAGDLIAAYGLLRPGASGLDQLGARSRVRPEGPCRIPGRLVDLGDYPGLVAGPGEVAGDLLRLLDDEVGDLLDDFEDFDPAAPTRPGYIREKLKLLEPPAEAWIYRWRGPVVGRAVVRGGDWLRRRGV